MQGPVSLSMARFIATTSSRRSLGANQMPLQKSLRLNEGSKFCESYLTMYRVRFRGFAIGRRNVGHTAFTDLIRST